MNGDDAMHRMSLSVISVQDVTLVEQPLHRLSRGACRGPEVRRACLRR